MNDRFTTAVIGITAITYAGFAVWLGLRPEALLEAFGIEDRTPSMATEIRAFYGGIEMAIAVAMVVLWRRGDLFAALLVGALPLTGSALGRLIGMLVDGYSSMHMGMASFELVGAGFCWIGCRLVHRQQPLRA